MKSIISIVVGSFLFSSNAFSQSVCTFANKIETPAVSKPTNAQSSLFGTCDVVKIGWKGHAGQTYEIKAEYTDPASGQINPIVFNSAVACDSDLNCYVTLWIKRGALLNWSVQAVEVIDGRTFYSYPLRGEYTACDNVPVVTNSASPNPAKSGITEKVTTIKNDLKVYPNPATGELTVNWTSEYTGDAAITIMDMSGKTVKTINVKKVSENNTSRIPVHTLTSGLYFLNVKTKNGKSITTRFVKD